MIKEVLHETEDHMKKATDALHHQLAAIRTGRAATALVEHIMVDAYDTKMSLNQLAGISIPDSHSIAIQPYDAGIIRAIERAIQTSDLGLMPQNDGRVVRLNLPPLTEERRKDLVKMVRHRVEEVKVSLRNHRRDAIDMLRQMEHEKIISEDEQHQAQDDIQKIIDRYSKELDVLGAEKEAEVMEV